MIPNSKILLTLVSVLLFAVIAVIGIQNNETQIPLTVLNTTLPSLPLGMLLVTAAIIGSTATFLNLYGTVQTIRQNVKQQELRKEKAEVKAETSSDQIRALESKIKTLEKALEQALSTSSSRKNR